MATLGQLVVNLEANIASFTRDMQRASQQTDQAMGRINGALDTVRNGLLALGAGATIGALGAMVKASIDAADSLRDMSQKTGVAVETLNGLGFAAGQAGGSLESMVAASGKLNKAVAEAASGNKETSAAFKALGIDVQDASGKLKTADVVIAEVADRFQNYADGPEKSALALRLFGKAGADMIPLLNEGGDALRENIEYSKRYSSQTTELSNAADNFNDTMGKLIVHQKSFGNTLSAAVLPVLQKVADEMLGAAEGSNKFSVAGEALRTTLEAMVILGSEVGFAFGSIGRELGALYAQAESLGVSFTDMLQGPAGIAAALVKSAATGKMSFAGFTAISDAVKADSDRARKEHDAFIASVLDRTPAVAAATETGGTKPAAPRMPGNDSTKSAAEKEISDRVRVIAGLNDEAIARQAYADIVKESDHVLRDFAATQKYEFDQAARAIQQNESNVERIRQTMLTEVQAEAEAHQFKLEELQKFHDAKLENEKIANALIEAEKARHEQAKSDMERARQQQAIGMAGDSASQLYSLLQQAGLEQTALGKALFIANKALAVAEIIMNTEVAASAALKIPVIGMGLAAAVRVMGYASAGIVMGTTIASAEGGYDIPRGVNPLTQLHEEEMVLPKGPANVIRSLAERGVAGGGANVTYSPVIHIDSRTDQAEVHKLVVGAVQQGNADLVDKLQRAGRI